MKIKVDFTAARNGREDWNVLKEALQPICENYAQRPSKPDAVLAFAGELSKYARECASISDDGGWRCILRTFTVRYKESNGRYVERVVEARDRRDAFKIVQRHHVNPVSVTEGGVLAKEGEPQVPLYGPDKVSISDEKPWWKCLVFWR